MPQARHVVLAALLALLVLPAGASAATKVNVIDLGGPSARDQVLSVTNRELITPAQRIRITLADGLVTVRDELGGSVTAGRLCRRVGAQTDRVVCPFDAPEGGIDAILAETGPGDDRFTNATGLPARLDGGGEDDVLTGGSADDVLLGGPGDDVLSGSASDDVVDGGSGDDTLRGGLDDDVLLGQDGRDQLDGDDGDDLLIGGRNPDDMQGGTGIDTVDYSSHPLAAVTVTLDGAGNDGNTVDASAGLADNVRGDVENVVATAGNDLLVGSASANMFDGLDGDDLLQTGGGDDRMLGGAGRDTFAGGPGIDTVSYRDHDSGVFVTIDDVADDGNNAAGRDDVRTDVENVEGTDASDNLTGSAGPNRLAGLGGIDVIEGGAGEDVLLGGAGNDREIRAQDGEVDRVSCGSGTDSAALDLRDIPTPVVELLDRSEVITAPSDCEFAFSTPFGETPTVGLALGSHPLHPLRARVSCLAIATRACRGRILVDAVRRGRARRLGAARFLLEPGAGTVRTITLTRAERRILRRARRVRFVATATGPNGLPHTAVRMVNARRRSASKFVPPKFPRTGVSVLSGLGGGGNRPGCPEPLPAGPVSWRTAKDLRSAGVSVAARVSAPI